MDESINYKIIIIAQAGLGKTLSGGDRIFIELARNWSMRTSQINIWTGQQSYEVCKKYRLVNVKYEVIKAEDQSFPFFLSYILRICRSIIKALKAKISDNSIIYSSSDFLADSLPAFIIKKRFRKSKWIAGFYLFAPKPWQKDSPYKGKRFLIGLVYWLTQIPIYLIVKRYADIVFVTSEPDVKRFITYKRDKTKILVIRGGVDIAPSTEYLNSKNIIKFDSRQYDAVFIGRLHYQKGAFELIDIWKLVCEEKPDAKLILIGDGPLENQIRKKISHFNLNKNIKLVGFQDGESKYNIFKQSKIVVHPATYDSGGMAAAEAMAWMLPGVSFDLESLKTYYPRGMSKIPWGNYKEFAREIIKLLSNKERYMEMASQARDLIVEEWDWTKRANFIYNKVMENI